MIKGESPAEHWQVSEAKVIQKGGALPAPLSPCPPSPRLLTLGASSGAQQGPLGRVRPLRLEDTRPSLPVTQASGPLPPDGPRPVPREGLLCLVRVCAMAPQAQGQKGRQRVGNTSRSWRGWGAGRRRPCSAPCPPQPAVSLRECGTPLGSLPRESSTNALGHPCGQNSAPLRLPGPSGPRAPHALATHAWTGPWGAAVRTGSPPSNPHPLRVPRGQQVQAVGAGGWRGAHVRLVQGPQSEWNPSGAEVILRRASWFLKN